MLRNVYLSLVIFITACSISLSASARSIVAAQELAKAVTALMETTAGRNFAVEALSAKNPKFISTTNPSKISVKSVLEALEANPKLKAQILAKSGRFIEMANNGMDYAKIKQELALKISHETLKTNNLKVTNFSPFRKATIERLKADPRIDPVLAKKAITAVEKAQKTLGVRQFVQEGFINCIKAFKPKAVNNANKLTLTGAQAIIKASLSGIKQPISLLNHATKSMITKYSTMFSLQVAKAKKAVCTLASKRCNLWNTGTACL